MPRLLVALDFDGTVAPLVDDPATSRPVPEAADAVRRLAGLAGTSVAYVSGRPLADLMSLTGAGERVILVGSHGAEVSSPGTRTSGPRQASPLALDAAELRSLETLRRIVHSVRERFPAARVEDKPAGMGLHTRGLEPGLAGRIFATARSEASRAGRYIVREGKDILEFAVRDDTKGDAVRRLRTQTAADAVFFAGDDRTDEDGFAALTGPKDVGVKVGTGASAAPWRVEGPVELADVLARIAALRAPNG